MKKAVKNATVVAHRLVNLASPGLMKIYTKSGDKGTTALYGGKRVAKNDPQVEAYGSVDELASWLGMILSYPEAAKDKELLTQIQRNLHAMMSILCNAPVEVAAIKEHIHELEEYIDDVEKQKPTGTKFILIQGTQVSVVCHIARTVCRRAERNVITFLQKSTEIEAEKADCMVQYLNRLSDMLYAMGRMQNVDEELFV
jgi:cob(I)alamin adenosyltransferase